MRTSLLPNLIAAVARNQSYGRPDVALFEVGSVFLRTRRGGQRAAAARARRRADVGRRRARRASARARSATARPWDAFDAKALALEAIRAVAGDVRVARAADDATSRICIPASPASSSLDREVDRLVRRGPSRRSRAARRHGRGVRVRGRARQAAARAARADEARSRGSRARSATSRCCSPRTSRRRASSR